LTTNCHCGCEQVRELVPFASRRLFHRLLITAALNGHSTTVQLLVEALSQVLRGLSSRPLFFNHAFAAAARNGHLETARLLLLPMRVAEGTRNQCLQVAAERGSAAVVELLLDYAARGAVRRALQTAAARGHEGAMAVLMASPHVGDEDRERARAQLAAQREAREARRLASDKPDGWLSEDEDEGEEDIMATRTKAAEKVKAYQETPRGGGTDEPYALGGHADHLGHVKDAIQRQRRGTGGGGGGGGVPSQPQQAMPPRRRPSYTGGPGGAMSPAVRARGAGFGFPAPPQGAAPGLRPVPTQPPPRRQQSFSTMEYK
jgi:hypothetical protein